VRARILRGNQCVSGMDLFSFLTRHVTFLLRPPGSKGIGEDMEHCMSALEKWPSKQRMKEILLEMKEIKELFRDIKKSERMSEGRDISLNEEEKNEERSVHGNKTNEEEERELKPWTRRVELPIFEGTDPLRWITRAKIFFEVQNVSAKEN